MASFDIDDEQIRKLAELLRETGLTEMEFAEGERRLRLTRAQVAMQPHVSIPAGAALAPGAAVDMPTAGAQSGGRSGAGSAPPKGAVLSPMVGTAYVAPEPGAKPFVQVGDRVQAGDTVLIIEAMKVMNPIKAPHGGTVNEIFVTDAQPVEYGEPLLAIE